MSHAIIENCRDASIWTILLWLLVGGAILGLLLGALVLLNPMGMMWDIFRAGSGSGAGRGGAAGKAAAGKAGAGKGSDDADDESIFLPQDSTDEECAGLVGSAGSHRTGTAM